MTAQKSKKGQKSASLEQVDTKDLTPPTEPVDVTEANVTVDVEAEEKELKELQAKAKAIKDRIAARKKQTVGSAKLDRKREWAVNATSWLLKPKHVSKTNGIEKTEKRGGAAVAFVESVERANQAVAALQDYEAKIELPKAERLGNKWAETMAKATEAAEILSAAYKLSKSVQPSVTKDKS
jgi:hypothetical protein